MNESNWKKLTEILPEKGQDVLLYSPKYGYIVGNYTGNIEKMFEDFINPTSYTKFTHWMELPDPPHQKQIESEWRSGISITSYNENDD
jgi:uncharacterized protein DUF551